MNLMSRAAVVEKVDAEGEIDLAISSETPYERFFGIEILGHKAEEIDLGRLNDGRHPLLMDHDLTRQVGVITGAVVGKDSVLRGRARFSARSDAQDTLRDVRDGIKTLVSVGYMVEKMVELKREADGQFAEVRSLTWPEFEAEQRELHGPQFYRAGLPAARAKGEEPPVYRVTRWTPFEASLVAVPADATVGVGRSAEQAAVQQQPAAASATPAIFVSTTSSKEMKMSDQTKDPATADRERVADIIERGKKHSKYVTQDDVANAIRNGHSREQFLDLVWSRIESRHTDTSELHIGMTKSEAQRYSFGRALVAALTGDWSKAGLEREASSAMTKLTGKAPEGFYLPFDVFRRDFNVGTAAQAGNFVDTQLRGDLYVDALRNATVLGGLGARILPGLTSNVDIPRKVTPTTLTMVTEVGSAAETQPATAKPTLSPKRISAFVEVSKQALIQSFMSLEDMLRDDLVAGAAVLMENQAINGPGGAPNMLGLRNVSGIGTVVAGANGLAPAWSHFVDLETACAVLNAEPDRLAGYLTNARVRGAAKKTQMGTDLGFIWQNGGQPINSYRVAITNNVPSNLTKGTSTTVCSSALFSSDWSMAVLGLFGGPDVVVDPYSKSDAGQVKITLNQFSDFVPRLPEAFSKVDDLLA